MIAQLDTLNVSQSGRVLTVRIDNPPRNLLDGSVGADLAALVRDLEGDRSIGAVVITGEPDRICVSRYDTAELLRDAASLGWTLSFRQAELIIGALRALRRVPLLEPLLRRTPARGVLNLFRLNDTFRRISRMDKVFVAAMNGMAVGGGLLIPLACDLRVVADDAGPIGLPEATIGFIAGAGGTQRARHYLGASRAVELLLAAPDLSVEEAIEIGLVHEVVPRPSLLGEAQARADRLASLSPQVVAASKRLVYGTEERAWARAIRREEALLLATLTTAGAERLLLAYTDRLGMPDETDADQIEAYRRARDGVLVAGDGSPGEPPHSSASPSATAASRADR